MNTNFSKKILAALIIFSSLSIYSSASPLSEYIDFYDKEKIIKFNIRPHIVVGKTSSQWSDFQQRILRENKDWGKASREVEEFAKSVRQYMEPKFSIKYNPTDGNVYITPRNWIKLSVGESGKYNLYVERTLKFKGEIIDNTNKLLAESEKQLAEIVANGKIASEELAKDKTNVFAQNNYNELVTQYNSVNQFVESLKQFIKHLNVLGTGNIAFADIYGMRKFEEKYLKAVK